MPKIVIVGGGIMGSSIAWHLAKAGAAADVAVIEPDPTYAWAATPRAVGGVRLLQGFRQNAEMSRHGLEVYSRFQEIVVVDGRSYGVELRKEGYMFLVQGADRVAALAADARMQREVGIAVEVLDRAGLEARFPSLNFAEADAGALSPDSGRIDPHAALMGYRRNAEHLGVAYLKDRVTGIDADRARATAVRLESGRAVAAEIVINAANCWAPDVAAMLGMRLPVAPVRRQTFFFDAQDKIEPIPALRHSSGFGVRPDGKGYLAGLTDSRQGFYWDLDESVFEDRIWPWLAGFSKAFEAIKLRSGWSGHYDMCLLDGNPIIGPWIGGLDNFYVVCGFSGHGLQHAPAVGRGMAELLLKGRFESIDLAPFSYRRVVENRPLLDQGPTA
jgi:glycine/D-amino acid oxidase-like deaminating enzyme